MLDRLAIDDVVQGAALALPAKVDRIFQGRLAFHPQRERLGADTHAIGNADDRPAIGGEVADQVGRASRGKRRLAA